ncbi:MAG: hypothetical protein ACOYMV_11620 [Verrucomicrobiia bacterium]
MPSSPRQQLAVRDWLNGLLEDALKVSESFRAKIEEGMEDLERGRIRRGDITRSG